jgi:putative membrane protein
MNAMRECIAGFYSTVYWKELGTLALFLIPALLLGLLLRKPVIRLNDAFTEKLESTKLI